MNVAGANIRAIRTQLGLSLRALARATGLEVSTLSMIETGKQNLTEEKAKRIADVLHVSVGMLFSEPGLVEMAMLRMRKLPVLTNEQLHAWTGPEDFEEADEQEYLHTAIKVGSRHMFAVRIVDRANEPALCEGDLAIFDAKRVPKAGDVVLAQNKAGQIAIGRFRPDITVDPPTFDVVPYDRMFPEKRSGKPLLLAVRGVLAERRQFFPE